jgi:hypothetical protein
MSLPPSETGAAHEISSVVVVGLAVFTWRGAEGNELVAKAGARAPLSPRARVTTATADRARLLTRMGLSSGFELNSMQIT